VTFACLLQGSLQCLQNLKRDLRLGNIDRATATRCDLLLFCDLVPDCLGAEVLEWETFDGVDGED
jgi:hypothetical protein